MKNNEELIKEINFTEHETVYFKGCDNFDGLGAVAKAFVGGFICGLNMTDEFRYMVDYMGKDEPTSITMTDKKNFDFELTIIYDKRATVPVYMLILKLKQYLKTVTE